MNAPAWAKYRAQNHTGAWYWHSDQPVWDKKLKGYVPATPDTVIEFSHYGNMFGKRQCVNLFTQEIS